ncbi:MAG TPA: sigma-54 dependent transcriptional regulator [Terriglobales bacterium]|nr:sigma-54 dependent transcriptional regulator [Terriglobales bacterium]
MPRSDSKASHGSESGAAAVHGKSTPAILSSYVAHDPRSLALLEQVKKVAASTATVLIRGESGTGKDLLASLIHYLGANHDEPLLKIDCASLPQELMESELFGYERGAFTGAREMKRGRLEMAGSGSIVLDEIAALSLAMQAKLLRVLEEKRFDRLGGTKPVILPEGVRVIAITNVDLERAVAERSFRDDLFYRLNVIQLILPPLRERSGDIRPLAAHLLQQLCAMHRKPQKHVSKPALAALERYAFPGNIRELRNILERCAVASESPEIALEDLPAHVRSGGAHGAQISLAEMERAYIAEVLDYTRGKKSKAAEILGISRKNLLEKRKRYKLD